MPDEYTPEEITRIKSLLINDEIFEVRSGNTVTVPAGSVDALADAIAEAGEGGTVVLESGMHTENNRVVLNVPIKLTGEPDAVLVVHSPDARSYVNDPGILIEADKVEISNIHFLPDTDLGGNCIWIHSADKVNIHHNNFDLFELSIINDAGDQMRVHANTIVGADIWLSDFSVEVHGVINMNGRSASITNNNVTGCIFGIWSCDKGGINMGNETTACLYGQILCNVPEDIYTDPYGNLTGSHNPGNHWILALNNSHDNYDTGFVIIDGANYNLLVSNKAADNANYDFEFTKDTDRFGFLVPGSHDNRGYFKTGQIVKDCGVDNKIYGGDKVDTSIDACY
ncbi:MAG: hypothetical protein KDC28_13695 [Saprospiraceae bacterium]|nr:hypothetical protein [Saprospiraceae bacterium]MCB9321871.1 hypothetical protein [Lewinellaceae bacterium]